MKKSLEVCIGSDCIAQMKKNIIASLQVGAERIELCAHMDRDGLTPSNLAIKAAKSAMTKSAELLVMIRPHHDNFCYTNNELRQMRQQITQAASLNADGVVLGVLNAEQHIDTNALKMLVSCAKEHQLSVTFHRAFDMIPPIPSHQEQAIEQLAISGIDRLLTSGNQWQTAINTPNNLPNREQSKQLLQPTQPNIAQLTRIAAMIAGRYELVVGGGVTVKNSAQLWQLCRQTKTKVSLHCHSAVLDQNNHVNPKYISDILSSPKVSLSSKSPLTVTMTEAQLS